MSTYYFPIIQSKVINKNYLFPSVLCPFIYLFFSLFFVVRGCVQTVSRLSIQSDVAVIVLTWQCCIGLCDSAPIGLSPTRPIAVDVAWTFRRVFTFLSLFFFSYSQLFESNLRNDFNSSTCSTDNWYHSSCASFTKLH